MKQTANREHYKPMKANFCYEQEDRRLQAGQEVVVCWRANGYAHHVLAQVVALTRLQVTVVLFSAPGGEDRYRAGDQLTIPRYANRSEWSSSRSVRISGETCRQKDFL